MAIKVSTSEVKLDTKDRKILFELDFNARQSNSALAKSVGLSKQGVDYRIKRLQGQGVIEGYYTVINIMRLGYFYCRLIVKLQNLTRVKEKEVYDYLLGDERFRWVLKGEGNYDTFAAMWAKNLTEFKRLSEELLEKFGGYIKVKKESLGIKITHFQSRYISGSSTTKEFVVAEAGKADFDGKDISILKAIAGNARIPVVELARLAGVSAKVASYRLKRLEKEGIILGYRPNINHNLLGFTHYKIFFYLSNVTGAELKRFKGYLKTLPEVIYVVEEIGISDVDVEIMLPSTKSFFTFIDNIKLDFPTLVKDYEIVLLKKTLKIDYLPF